MSGAFGETVRTANRNLRGAKGRTALTVLSLVVGAFTLTLGLGVGAGLSSYTKDQVNAVRNGDVLQISHGRAAASLGFAEVKPYDEKGGTLGYEPVAADDLDAVRGVAGVARVEPQISVSGEYLAYQGKKFTVGPSELLPTMKIATVAGSVADVRGPADAVLGNGFVRALGFASPAEAVGKQVTVVVLDQLRQPRAAAFTIRAVSPPSLLLNGALLIKREALVAMQTFQASGVGDALYKPATAIAYLADSADVAAVQAAIGKLGLTAQTDDDLAEQAADSLRPLQTAVIAFALVAILASVFGIVNTLLMSVMERTREVGLLKALGARDRAVFALFSVEAVLLGLWGSVLGMVAAVAVGWVLSPVVASAMAGTLPGLTAFQASPATLFTAPAVLAVVALLAGVLPARRAMRLDPITALRHE